jgi:dTDP-4-amino-4,6-dideoxygalactose transaminase
VVAVHLFGHPAAMTQLHALARGHHLALVEDAAQAAGAALNGEPVGTLGDAACFSFYPTKNMHAIEGGMVVTDDASLADQLRLLRNQGMRTRFEYELVGTNARLSEVHAAVGRVQLNKLAQRTRTRAANAAYLTHHLTGVITPATAAGATHAYNQYTIRTPQRDHLRAHLAAAGIQTAVYYPTPVHRTPAYQHATALPQTERAADEVLSLPVHPALAHDDLVRIVEAVNTWTPSKLRGCAPA